MPYRLLVISLILSFTLAGCTENHSTQRKGTGPNIILIMTDDQAASLTRFMPTVQRELVAKGSSFRNAYATTSLCCPSRTTALRGQYVHNHGVLSNGGSHGGFPKLYQSGREHSTLATWLSDKGYTTALMGKYLNSYPFGPVAENPQNYRKPNNRYIPPGWSRWFAFYDTPLDLNNTPYHMYNLRVNDQGRSRRFGYWERDYQTDVLSREASTFLDAAQHASQPFFLFLTPTAPHIPTVPAKRHVNALANVRAPRSLAFNEGDTSDKPRWVQRAPRMSRARVKALDSLYRQEAQMLLAVDDMIKGIIDTLRETKQLHNTYIIFTSDQGLHHGEHRLDVMKLTPYQASTHIPLIIRGPGVPAGKTFDQLILNTDFAPTIAALGKAKIPDFVDGRDLSRLWKRPEPASWRQQGLLEFWPRESLDAYGLEHVSRYVAVPKYRALKSARYLYAEYTYKDGSAERELYDLGHDPNELNNIAATANPALLSALEQRVAALSQCRAQTCRDLENAPLP